jgi:outer membrane protein OmpA-like peptidoglycan-associated protein/osmotically-inducible protein OsmY
MCNWRDWLLPGLLTLLIITAAAILIRGGPIEADLTARSTDNLGADGTPWASTVLDGRDATLSGIAPTLAAREAAIAASQRVWGVRTVDVSALEVLPLAEPYALTFTRTADSVTVQGSFPTGETRVAILDSLRADLGNLALVDESQLARGAPLAFESQASFASASLSALETGTITLEDGVLTVDGMTASVEALDAELARLGSPIDGLEVGEIALTSPDISPYVWSAQETDAGVTLSGYVPDAEVRQSLVSAAENIGTVTDDMQLGAGAPDGFADAAMALLGQMADLDNAAASITDVELSLSGEAASEQSFDSANAFLGRLPTGFDSISGRIAPPLADPFVISLSKTGDDLTITGFLPDETARAVLRDRVESVGLTLSDQTTIARGNPEGISIGDLLVALTDSLDGLSNAEAMLSDAVLSVSGQSVTFAQAQEAEDALGALESPALTVETDIMPGPASPFAFSAVVGEGEAMLSGFVPSEEQKQAILMDVAALFPSRDVSDDLTVAAGAPEGFATMVQVGLRALGRLADGRFSLSDSDASLSGRALIMRSIDQIEESVTIAMPGSFNVTSDVGLLAPPAIVDAGACQARFADLLSGNAIRFATGSADIDALSFGLLDRLVRTLQSCPDAQVEIAGHTDAQGSDTANLSLSQQRASSVLAYVEAAGISSNRLSAVGYGEAAPVADNNTEEGRARNRRIEFTVQRDIEQ